MSRPLNETPEPLQIAEPLNWRAPVLPTPAEVKALINIRYGLNGIRSIVTTSKGRRKASKTTLEALKDKGWAVKTNGRWNVTEAGLELFEGKCL